MNKHTTIEHKRTATPLSVYQISQLAAEIVKSRSDNSDSGWRQAFELAFELLSDFNAKLQEQKNIDGA